MHRCTLLHAQRSVPTAHNMLTISFMPAITSTTSRMHGEFLRLLFLQGPPRDRGALHRHRHASATTLRFISLSPRRKELKAGAERS